MLIAIAAASFATVALTVWGVSQRRESVVRRRLGLAPYPEVSRERRLEGSVGRRIIGPAAGKVGRFLAQLLPQNAVRDLDRMLVMAGEPMSLPAYLSLWATLVLGGALGLAYVIAFGNELTGLQLVGIGLLIMPFAVLAPYVVLRRRVKNRQKTITRALPDALDLLVTSVEAGLGVDAAFAMVAEQTSVPLSETFTLYLKE